MGPWRGWVVVSLMGLGCGRTDLDSPPLIAFVDPPEQTITLGATASFRGSASESVEGPVTFGWRIFSRPGVTFAAIASQNANAELKPDLPGDWVIELKASADARGSAPVMAVIHVQPAQSMDSGVLPADAGVDAGPRDAGFDAGTRDAGFDAGVRDAGQDAGARDAGFDAGVADAGFDAGPNPQPLDAGAIYLAGTLSPGACALDALADLFNPNVASTGFDCYFANEAAMLRPTDGALLYFNTFEWRLREYRCDDCNVTSVATPYPPSPLANDPVIPTPCPGTDRMSGFLVSADGEVLHRCYLTAGTYRDSTGAAVYSVGGMPFLSLGSAGWALSSTRVVNWKTGTVTPISGLPTVTAMLATRWSPPNGFFMAIASGGVEELWRVDVTGAASWVGTYGPTPPNTSGAGPGRLDATGRLFQEARDTSVSFRDIVLMKQIGAPTTVAYTEATNPLVKLHISSLVTGP